jgi:hypothetical protein
VTQHAALRWNPDLPAGGRSVLAAAEVGLRRGPGNNHRFYISRFSFDDGVQSLDSEMQVAKRLDALVFVFASQGMRLLAPPIDERPPKLL